MGIVGWDGNYGKDELHWHGTLSADKFRGNGSLLTGVSGTPVFGSAAVSGGVLVVSGALTYPAPQGILFLDVTRTRVGVLTTSNFGSVSHPFHFAVEGNIYAQRIYSGTFRDAATGNTWVAITGSAPNQVLTIGNGGILSVLFQSKAVTGKVSFDNSVGIGTTNPDNKLTISGALSFTNFPTPATFTSSSGAIFVSGGELWYKGFAGTFTRLAAS
jgi:hypothetical protein